MNTTVVVIGAGQAGLAMSRLLTEAQIDHVVLERSAVAHAWRAERWDSLRLLTPNWLSRLPGHRYGGPDPDGYMSSAEVAHYLGSYAASFGAPVQTGVTVNGIRPTQSGSLVETDQGPWRCQAVVIATGSGRTAVPAIAADLPARIRQLPASQYRNPEQVETDGVLVVGASASGVQIADELSRSGRKVWLAVGDHVRVPRTYRGRDIHWWLDATGKLDERIDEIENPAKARRAPSLQLVGSANYRNLDLNALAGQGVELLGRLVGVSRRYAQFSGSLASTITSADLRQHLLLDRIDGYVDEHALAADVGEPVRPAPTVIPDAVTGVELTRFATVIWSTGFQPRLPGLPPELFDRRGQLRHSGGVLEVPGMYVLGLPFLRRRKSTFIDGVGPDAHELCEHLVAYLDEASRSRGPVRLAA